MQDNNWFTEECLEGGTALSFKIDAKLHEEQTPCQKIEIYATRHFGKLMVIDGFIMLTERDNFIYHEMLTHPVLLSHPEPRKVLIVGGGDCGTLREVVKHRCIEKIIQVEIDRRVTELSKQYFPQLCEANNDPRVELIFDDAIEWIKKEKNLSLDIIIVDSTDPIGPAKGLFATSFYRDCAHILNDEGIIVQQSESPLLHLEMIIKPMHKRMRKAGFLKTELMYFPVPSYPTGWWTASIASKCAAAQFRNREPSCGDEIKTRYYNHAIHHACFAAPEFVLEVLADSVPEK